MAVTGIRDIVPGLIWEDAFLAGNGEHGIMVFGAPGHERVVHTHHRFVLPGPSRTMGPPALADRLEEVRDLILAGRRREAQRRFTDGRPLAWTQPFHPGHVLHLDGAGAAPDAAGYERRTDFTTGEVTSAWGGGAWRHRAFVSRPDRVAVHEITGRALDVDLRLSAATPGLPDDIAVRTRAVVEGDGRAWLTVVATYPPVPDAGEAASGRAPEEGFAGVTRVVLDGGTATADGDVVRVRGARGVLLVSRWQRWAGAPPLDELREDLAALPADLHHLRDRHAAVHGELFARCSLDLGPAGAGTEPMVGDLLARARRDPLDPALLEALFASGRYLLLSSCGVLPPRLTGLWLGAWGAAWSGDLTTDANLNLQVAGLTTTGMPELLDGYAAMVAAQADDWRLNARSVYGARGFLAPSRTDGEHGRLFHLDEDWPWAMWLAGADWLLLPLLERWQADGDDAFLADVLAPWLAEAARFFEDVLTRIDAAGHVVLVPSYSPEVGPDDGEGAAAVNATMDVAAARHALVTAAAAVTHLRGLVREGRASVPRVLAAAGVVPEDADRWRALAARLPPYRVDERGALAEWAWPGLATPLDHRHVSHLYPVWPLHEITPEHTPALARAALAALEARGGEDLSAHGSLHRALVAARLGQPRLVQEHVGRILGRDMLHRSLMTSHNPGLRTYNADAAHALPALVVELVLGSAPGRISLLSALPAGWERGVLRGSPTRAGVLVEELAWDTAEGWVRVVLSATAPRLVTLTCREAADPAHGSRQLEVRPGAPREVVTRLRPAGSAGATPSLSKPFR
ncbi:MAG: glycoside hydrolase N-terminal domain-containing protein [Kineosporiaceae bacterium]